jgi:serine beta-lactamase-like protein LACTB, mitochondrial
MKAQYQFHRLLFLSSIFILLFSCNKKPKDESVVQNMKYKQSLVEVYRSLGIFCNTNSIPGLSIAVSIDNQIVLADGFGYSNLELKTKASPTHLFRIGQLSQIITSLTAAKLYEEGKLQLNEPVNELFPDFNTKSAIYTLYQLGVQSSGINEPKPIVENVKTNSLEEYITTLKSDLLVYEPGTNVLVSDTGFDLLGYFIQKSANASFSEVVRKTLLNKLQLIDTRLDNPYAIIDKKSSQYDLSVLSGPGIAQQMDLRSHEASSGYLSSVFDLIKIGNALIYPGFLKKETIDMITKPFVVKTGQNTIFGFGLVVKQDSKGRYYYSKKGNINGGSAAILIIPEDKLVIVIASNIGNSLIALPIFDVASIFQNQLHPEWIAKKEEQTRP